MPNIATPRNSKWAKRQYKDEPQPNDPRTPFQHDKDRILHSTAFRRLQYKTQVYVIHEGDLYRTRLTHSLEVAQIARGLAFLLRADCDLAEAISLAHDLGHAPFGHIGGDELRVLLSKCQIPFDHNVQSYRIVSNLEERYCSWKGLNLTKATLEGILRHSTPFDQPKDISASIPEEIREEVSEYLNGSPYPGVETQIVNMADIIAYATHDIEDALAMGLISWDTLESKMREEDVTFVAKIKDCVVEQQINGYKERNPYACNEIIQKLRLRTMSREMINYLIRQVYEQTKSNIQGIGVKKKLWVAIREHTSPFVALPKALEGQVERLVDKVLLDYVYHEPRVMIMMLKAKRIIEVLFESFMNNPKALPKITQGRLTDYFAMTEKERKSKLGKKKLAQVVGDYISGMTDKYAMDTYQLLTQAYEKAL